MRLKILLAACVSLLPFGAAAHAQSASADPAAPAPPRRAESAAQTGESPQAQSAPTSDDIVVTASRQGAQSLQSVPLAIQAFGGEQLQRQQINETSDLFRSIPGGAMAQQIGSVIKTFTLRGVGATSGVGDSPIGYYIDDVPFAIANFPLAPPVRFVDIDRIEVLRGPQGTLYGQGSAGGTIIYHTRDPNLDHVQFRSDTYLSGTKGAGGLNFGASGAVSVPLITDKLAIRVSGGYDRRPGYIDVYAGLPTGNPIAKNANDIQNKDIRAVLLWKPDDKLSLRAQIFHFEPSQDYTQSLQSLDPAQLWFNGSAKGNEKGNFDLYSLSAAYDLGFANLTSATSYFDAKASYLQGTVVGVPGLLFNGYDAYSFAQELQLRSAGAGPFHWLGGFYYQKAAGTFAFDANFPGFLVGNGYTRTKTENYSGFGEVSYDLLGGKIVPLFGIRYYKDDRTFVADSFNIPIAGAGVGGSKPDKLTWRANVSFFPSDNFTGFVTVSTGFRSGIIQTPLGVVALGLVGIPSSIALKPDTVTNYEAGLKARAFDGAVQLGLNVYRIDFKDNQLGLTPLGIGAFANAGKARTDGIDLEIRWRTPLPGLNVGFVGNRSDSTFRDVPTAITAQMPSIGDGKRLSNTAKYNYRFDADYEAKLSDDLRLFANGSASRIGNRIMVDGYSVPAYSLVDASVGVRSDKWEVALFGENLGDERGPSYALQGTSGPGVARFTGPYPRTIGLRLRTHFD